MSDYMASYPIIGRIFSLLVNKELRILYEYAMGINNIYSDLIEMEKIEFGAKFNKLFCKDI